MKLKRLNRQTLKSAPRHAARIRFNKSGAITLSAQTVINMQLKAGDYIEILQDEENAADFFITRCTPDKGFELRGNASRQLMMNSASVVTKIFEALKITSGQKSIICQMAKEYIFEGKERLWPIITSSAKLV